MTVTLHDATNHNGLIDLQGKCFYLAQLLDTARNSTLPNEASNIQVAWNNLTWNQATANLPASILTSLSTWQAAGAGLFVGTQTTVQQLLTQLFLLDGSIPTATLAAAMAQLYSQMVSGSQTVKASTVTTTATPNGSNVGNGVLLVSKRRGDGRVQETAFNETLQATCSSGGSSALFSVVGQPSVPVASQAWPAGSGSKTSLSAITPDASLLTNGGFETAAALATVPDNWIVSVGTPGMHVKPTAVEVQQVVVSGSPSAGAYYVSWTNPAGQAQTTGAIAYNASAATLQAALRLLAGLGSVTVASTGTSPNFTHVITFSGVGGSLNLVSVANDTTGGTFTVTRTTAGTGLVFAGSRAVAFASDGSTLITLNQQLTGLLPDTVYGISLWCNETGGPAAGVVTVDLANGIGGTTLTDDRAHAQSFTFNANAMTGSWQHLSALVSGDCCFKTPLNLPGIVYLRIRISTAVTNGCTLYFDQAALAPLTSLYSGGPLAGIFTGSANFQAGDSFALAVTNDFGGKVQTAYSRFMGTGASGLLLPSVTDGSETIPDSVIAS